MVAKASPVVLLIFLLMGNQARSEGLGNPSQQQLAQSSLQAGTIAKKATIELSCQAFDIVDYVRPREEAKKGSSGLKRFCGRLSDAGFFVGLAIPLGVLSQRKARITFSFGEASIGPRVDP